MSSPPLASETTPLRPDAQLRLEIFLAKWAEEIGPKKDVSYQQALFLIALLFMEENPSCLLDNHELTILLKITNSQLTHIKQKGLNKWFRERTPEEVKALSGHPPRRRNSQYYAIKPKGYDILKEFERTFLGLPQSYAKAMYGNPDYAEKFNGIIELSRTLIKDDLKKKAKAIIDGASTENRPLRGRTKRKGGR
jgi:hypothetical protein